MRLHRHDGIPVQQVQYHFVSRVAQVVYGLVQQTINLLHFIVRLVFKEHTPHIRSRFQPMCLGVCLRPSRNFAQQFGIVMIVGFVYNHLFRHNMAFHSHTQKAHQHTSVGIEVKHGRVFVGLIGNEHRQRGKHHRCQQLAKPHIPDTTPCHLVACVVENIIHDEHQHRHDNRYTQSTFANDGTQRSTDKEEDKARQRHQELLVHLYLMLPYHAVCIFRHHRFKFHVGTHSLYLRTCHAQYAPFPIAIQSGKSTIHVKSFRFRFRHSSR